MTSKSPDNKNKKSQLSGADALGRYMNDISRIQPLKREEEIALAMKAANNNVEALQELIRRNLKYVVSVANKYRGFGMSIQDLIEEGNIGLVQDAKRFDPDRKVRFITYAVWWIRQAILHSLADQAHTVRIPVKQAGKMSKIGKSIKGLTQSLDREPTQTELARDMGLKEEEIENILRAYRTGVSLDSPLKGDVETPYIDLLESADAIPFDDQIMKDTLRDKIDVLLKDLSEREETILRLRFGFNGDSKTLEEIGLELGLSRERVRQIEKKAKNKLKLKSKSLGIEDQD